MNKQNKKMTIYRWSGIPIFITALIFGNPEVQAKVYSVQVGAFQIYANAQDRYNFLKKTTPSHLLDHLRIERKGKFYKVKVGKAKDSEKAMNLLLAIQAYYPDAFIVPGEAKSEIIPRPKDESVQSIAPLTVPKKRPPPLEKRGTESAEKADSTSSVKKTEMTGTISEINSMDSEQFGLPPGITIYQLIIWVEGTRTVSGSPDILKENIGELMTFFSETRPSFLNAGNKIEAMVEYRGNQYGSLYWIVQPQMAKP